MDQLFKFQKQKEKLKKADPNDVEEIFDKLRDELEQRNSELATVQQQLAQYSEERQKTEEKATTESPEKLSLHDEIAQYILNVMNDIKHKLGPWKNIDQLYACHLSE